METKLYRTVSCLGGMFTVAIDKDQDGATGFMVRVRVHMPSNRDWHGYSFGAARDQLKPVEA